MTLLSSSVNGEVSSSISIQDRGLSYGDGLFETIALVNRKLIFWEQHYQRLASGCYALRIKCPTSLELKNTIDELLGTTGENFNLVVKLIITRGTSERGYRVSGNLEPNIVILLSTYPVYTSKFWLEGVKVKLCTTTLAKQKQLAGLKHLNRLEQVLARQEWDDEFQEGLMSDDEGCIVEGVMSNLFIVKNGSVFTPYIDNSGVDGIMRNVVLNLCESNGIIVKQDKITLDVILNADEVFLTNSIVGIWPVNKINEQSFLVGNITNTIMQSLVKKYLIDYATLSV